MNKKINHNNIHTFIKTYGEYKYDNFDEWLFVYIKHLSSLRYMNNILKSILPYDRSLEFDDLVAEIYIKAIESHNKGHHEDYSYSLYSFRFSVLKLCQHYKSTKKGLADKVSFDENDVCTNIKDSDNNIFLKDIFEILDENERYIVNLYFLEGYTFKEIGEKLSITHAGARYKINHIVQKLRDTL